MLIQQEEMQKLKELVIDLKLVEAENKTERTAMFEILEEVKKMFKKRQLKFL